MMETCRMLTMSDRYLVEHCRFDEHSKALFDSYHKNGKSIIVVMGHYGNWEWAGSSFSIERKQQLYAIYHPLSNKYFNRLIIHMRERYGTKLIAMKSTYREMLRHRSADGAEAKECNFHCGDD